MIQPITADGANPVQILVIALRLWGRDSGCLDPLLTLDDDQADVVGGLVG